MKFSIRTTLVTAALALVVGCDESPPPPAPPAATSGDAAKPAWLPVSSASAQARRDRARRERSARGKGGSTVLIQKALRELELDEQQKKTLQDALAQDRKADGETAARNELNQALAAGARAGALDDELVTGKVAALEAATKAKSSQVAATLNTLHEVLTPPQRKAFLASLDAGGTPMWSDEDAADERDRSRRLRSARGSSRLELARLMRGLSLNEEQRKKMKEAMAEEADATTEKDRGTRLTEIKKTRQAMKAAFASDTFDAAALTSSEESTARRVAGIHREVKAIRVLLPILDDEQREKLASALAGRRGRQRLGGRPDGSRGDDPRRSVRRNRPAAATP